MHMALELERVRVRSTPVESVAHMAADGASRPSIGEDTDGVGCSDSQIGKSTPNGRIG